MLLELWLTGTRPLLTSTGVLVALFSPKVSSGTPKKAVATADKLFKGSSELQFTQLVSDEKLTPQQIERMRELLAERARSKD